jgi:carbon monoxide dehydrogenase subunit G
MLHFEGDRDFPLLPVNVWSKLSDARFLVQCIPDVESISVSEVAKVICTIRPGFAFIRGTLELTVQVADAVPEKTVRLQLHTKGIGSTSDVEANLAVALQEDGTRVHWSADIQNLGGLLKAVPQGLIKASAQKIIGDVLAAVEKQIAA